MVDVVSGQHVVKRHHRGLDPQAAFVQELAAKTGGQLAPNMIDKIGRDISRSIATRRQLQGLTKQTGQLSGGQVAHLGQVAQDGIATKLRGVRMVQRREARRRLGQPRQQRQLGRGQLPHILVKVATGRGLNPEAAMAQEDVI